MGLRVFNGVPPLKLRFSPIPAYSARGCPRDVPESKQVSIGLKQLDGRSGGCHKDSGSWARSGFQPRPALEV